MRFQISMHTNLRLRGYVAMWLRGYVGVKCRGIFQYRTFMKPWEQVLGGARWC